MKVGVIGAGGWGKNHIRIFSELGVLNAIADKNPEAKKLAQEYNVDFYEDYEMMLDKVDAVSIVVPTDLHYEVVKTCLSKEKHVFVEKPITLDHKSSKELVDFAMEKGKILAVGYLFRFNAAVKKLKEEIKNMGKVHYITARYIHSNKPPRKDSGVIFNFGVHLVDIMNYILPEHPKKISCKKVNFLSDEYEDAAILNMDYGDFVASLEMSWLHPLKKRDLWVIGENFKIYADLFEQIVVKYPIKITREKTERSADVNLEINKNEPLKEELKAFITAVEKGEDAKFEGKEDIFTTKICELAFKSAVSGEEIKL